ncbi:MAG TPA: hypothetical protein VM241_01965 [Candidatus Thermoplasmatota archaeon]|nr:hypothetical protein [Candidatus Thermoplasmatota archaeon]
MELDALLNLALAALAFLLSVVATVFTMRSSQRDRQGALRIQLSSVMDEILDAAKENVELSPDGVPPLLDPKAMYMGRILMHRTEFLRSQALFLMGQLAPARLVSAVERHTVANACIMAGDVGEAERQYLAALDLSSPQEFNHRNLVRSYAQLLFWTQRREPARTLLRRTVDQFGQESDDARYAAGTLLVDWAVLEATVARDPEQAGQRYGEAQPVFAGIANPALRQNAMASARACYQQAQGAIQAQEMAFARASHPEGEAASLPAPVLDRLWRVKEGIRFPAPASASAVPRSEKTKPKTRGS